MMIHGSHNGFLVPVEADRLSNEVCEGDQETKTRSASVAEL